MNRRLLTNTIANSFAFVWRTAVGLLVTPFVVRALGKEGYGAWVFVTSFWVTGYLSFFDLGLQAAVVKYTAECHARREFRRLGEVVSAALVVYVLLGGLAAGALVVLAEYVVPGILKVPLAQLSHVRVLLYILAAQMLLEFPGLAFAGLLEGLQRFDLLRLIDVVQVGLLGGAVVVLLATGYGLPALGVMVFILAAFRFAVTAMAARWLLPREVRFLRALSRATVGTLVKFSAPVLAIRTNALVYNLADKMVIASMLGSTLLTDFDIANRVHMLAFGTLALFSSLTLPAAAAADALGDRDELRRLLVTGSKYTVALSLPVALIVFILARPLIEYWIGAEYAYVGALARLFLIYLLFWPLVQVGYNVMIGINQAKRLIPIQLASTVVNLGVSIGLTPRLGVAGVIVGTLVGNAIAFVFYLKLFLSALGVSGWEFVRGAVLLSYPQAMVTALALWAVLAVRPARSLADIVLYAGLGLAWYAVGFYLLGMNAQERRALRAAIARQR